MTGLIEDNYIFLNEDYKSKQELLSFIAAKAEELNICDTKEGLLKDLLAREDGFAIPHARSSHVKKVSVFFIRNKSVLDWETLDDSDVHYLFALLVPKENEGNIHLQMISKLATSLLEDDFKDKVKSTSDKSELKNYILKNITD